MQNQQMKIRGVITGDIVQSTAIRPERRQMLLDTIRRLTDDLSAISPIQMEFFRGDSFQILVDNPSEALKIAILIRAGLQQSTPSDNPDKWDARIAIGIGEINYLSDKVVISDGEAFHNSGREFDELGKKRLAIRTSWEEVNEELNVSTAFADDIISGWSITQAQAIYHTLLYQTSQKETASHLHKTAQAISKLLNTAKEPLIRTYMERYEQLIKTNIHSWK